MESNAELENIRRRLKTIVRRDLKLGDMEIADDMPFLNGNADLDSLDMLLLITSVEREFGFKVPSQEAGRSAFENVDSLTRYIAAHAARAGSTPRACPASSDVAVPDPLSRLPHADPFRFLTRLTGLITDESAEGIWRVGGGESFFAGHFPGRPIVPGVLLAEALAQLSGLIPATAAAQGRLAHVDVRFEEAIVPPADITLKSRLLKRVDQLHQFEVSASAAQRVAARGMLTLHLSEKA